MGSLIIGEEVELPALEVEENEEVVSDGLKKEAKERSVSPSMKGTLGTLDTYCG